MDLKTYLTAFCMVLLSEIGDKTQFIAISFALKYKVRDILVGIFLGAALNHGLAIALGKIVSHSLGESFSGYIRFFAGLIFIAFAVWTFISNQDDVGEEDGQNRFKRFGNIAMIAFVFFIGEMGDKTQMAAFTLSLQGGEWWKTLAGTTSAMVVAAAMGIVVGVLFGKKIPQNVFKWISVGVFAFFGFEAVYESAATFAPQYAVTAVAAIAVIAVVACGAKTMSKQAIQRAQMHAVRVRAVQRASRGENVRRIKER